VKWPLAVAFVCLWVGGSVCAAGEMPMPSWDPEVRKEMAADGWLAGADLLAESAEQAEDVLVLPPPNPEEISGDDDPVIEVPEEHLDAYFAVRPEKFLIDPQRLLSERDYDERLAFLDYHAGDSTIDLFVYLIGGEQEIPSEVREEELAERFFSSGRPAAIIYYYLGAPQRSALFLSPSLTDAISAPEQNRALESSIIQGFEKTMPTEQLERFLVQMSIRIYWMERKLGGQPVTPEEAGDVDLAVVMPEVAETRPMKFEAVRQAVVGFAVPAAVLLGALLSAIGLRHWNRSRVRYRFPDFEVEPRLGGSHAAGIGAVISFASASQTPASQRDQVPDYLRRARSSSIG
jgi:hypothetical protein